MGSADYSTFILFSFSRVRMRLTVIAPPGTVEQDLWGRAGLRSERPHEYRYASDDPPLQERAYAGMSW